MHLGTEVLNMAFSIVRGMQWGLPGYLFATFLYKLFTNPDETHM